MTKDTFERKLKVMRSLHVVTELVLTLIVIAMVVQGFRKSKDTLIFISGGKMVERFRKTELIWPASALSVGVFSAMGHGVLTSTYQVRVPDDLFLQMAPAPWTQLPLYMAFWPMFAAAAGTVVFFAWRLAVMSRRRPTFEYLA